MMVNNQYNAYSFDCYAAVFIRAENAKLQVYSPYIVSSTVGVSDALGGVVDTNGLFLLRVGVGLLTVGGGPSGGVGCIGAGDMAVDRHLTLGSGLSRSLGHGSLGGRGS